MRKGKEMEMGSLTSPSQDGDVSKALQGGEGWGRVGEGRSHNAPADSNPSS